MRYAAFALGLAAGVLELAGAIMGLGIAGIGFAFGGGGVISASTGVGMAITLAVTTVFVSVATMFVHDARPLGIILGVAAIGAAFAGGPYALPGAAVGLVAAGLAFRLDREGNLV